MLRELRRRYRSLREEPLARFALTVTAVSPFPEEPVDDEAYYPSLIVSGDSAPALPAHYLAIGTLLFVEWAHGQLGDLALLTRLRALLPRLRVGIELGRIGPERREEHRATQRERYFHHREAATYEIALHRDAAGPFVAVKRRIVPGRWTGEATLLEAATLAPYEALLHLAAPDGLTLLAWLARAVDRWRAERPAAFPFAGWDLDAALPPPGRE